jgi:hypothetical protein
MPPRRSDPRLKTEKVAYWFFRLNGCMTIENFVVHPDFAIGQRTDADILGIRFPHRAEGPLDLPMYDHPSVLSDRPLLFIAEIKLRHCELNGPWTDPEDGNLQRVLRAAGLHDPRVVEDVADALYAEQHFVDVDSEVRLFAIGDEGDDELRRSRPGVRTLLWADVLGFIHDRFSAYAGVKADHQQWDEVGKHLFDLVVATPDRDAFVLNVRRLLENEAGHRLRFEERSPPNP